MTYLNNDTEVFADRTLNSLVTAHVRSLRQKGRRGRASVSDRSRSSRPGHPIEVAFSG